MPEEKFIMSPQVDFVFKELMRDEMVRKGFLSAVLNMKDTDIQSTVLLNTNLPRIHEDEKQGILDVRLLMNDKTEIDIEIQVAYFSEWANRSIFYVSKMLVEQVGINRSYSNLRKYIGIGILNFKYIKNDDRFHTVYHFREDTNNNQYSDILEIHVIELPKLPKTDDRTDLYDWTRFIKAKNRSEIEMSAQNNTYIQKAYEMLEEISADEKMRLAYDARQKALYDENTKLEEAYERGRSERREEDIQTGILVGKKQGIKEGEELGERKTKQAMFEKMKLFGYSEEEIRRILS